VSTKTATDSAAPAPDPGMAARIQAEVDRNIQRYVKGLEFLSAPAVEVGTTPKDLVFNRGTLNFWHYRPMVEEIYRVPVLLVMATTNKGYIFDLAPGQSFVEFLLKAGYDVYLMDYNPPRPEEKSLRLEDYVLDFLPDCVDRMCRRSGVAEATVIGYCMGGVLSLIYAAAHPKGPLKNLVVFTTPVKWSKMGQFYKWSDKRYFDVDRLVATYGNLPPEMILASFEMLRPGSKPATQVGLWDNIWNDEFVKSYRMFDKWSNEMLPLAGEYFRQITKELMWEDKLFKGTLKVGGRTVKLSNVTVPIMSALAEHDHIVPYECAGPLLELVGSKDKQEIILKGGHVSVVAGPNAVKRLWPKVDEWLGARSV
jgi:polyhydroxyalkanoate synthase